VGERLARCAATAMLAFAALVGPLAPDGDAGTIRVRSETQFEAAVSALRSTGGTVVLLPHLYRGTLVVPPRSARPLRIVGTPGARVERVLLYRTQRVSLGGITIAPLARDAWVKVYASRRADLHDLTVTARGTGHSASVRLPYSRRVAIRRSTFTHCGDRSPSWSFCLLPRASSRHVTVEDNWFHDCYGCDFIHGRFGSDLTIRRNRLERALPCRMSVLRCSHQDLIEMFAGKRLRIEKNHFGVYAVGGAQLLLANRVDHVTIANNVFVGRDPRVPFYRSRVALGLGGLRRVPRYVKVVNNTILTGATRVDGYAASIALGVRYREIPRRERPIIVNNVIGLLRSSYRLCRRAQATISNLVVRGRACSSSDRTGPANLDRRGRPSTRSTLVIDGGNGRYAPTSDIRGQPRAPAWASFGVFSKALLALRAPALRGASAGSGPDIGAYEYVAPSRSVS
jgi:hypothetical protein